MIMFAPSGISGLIVRHASIARTRAFAGVLRAYALALVPLAAIAAGMVLLVEMSYRLATQPELGSRMRLLWTSVDAATAWPWIIAVVMLVVGFLLFRLTWRPIAAAWDRAAPEAAAR